MRKDQLHTLTKEELERRLLIARLSESRGKWPTLAKSLAIVSVLLSLIGTVVALVQINLLRNDVKAETTAMLNELQERRISMNLTQKDSTIWRRDSLLLDKDATATERHQVMLRLYSLFRELQKGSGRERMLLYSKIDSINLSRTQPSDSLVFAAKDHEIDLLRTALERYKAGGSSLDDFLRNYSRGPQQWLLDAMYLSLEREKTKELSRRLAAAESQRCPPL